MMNLHHCENLKPYPNTQDSRQYTVLCTGEVINLYTQYKTKINDPQWHKKNVVLPFNLDMQPIKQKMKYGSLQTFKDC